VNAFQRQPPVHSPIPVAALWRAAGSAVGGRDPRAQLAELLKARYAADDAVLTHSGTMALTLALRAAACWVGEARPTVALPAFTCFDVATAAVAADLPIVLYDVEPRTLAPDLMSLRAAMIEGARVVVVSPLYGIPVDWEAVEDAVRPFGALVVEDAAQGHGAEWRGRALGSFGRVSVLSFGRGKGWTGVQGGALLLRHGVVPPHNVPLAAAGLADEVGVLARALAQQSLAQPSLYGVPSGIPCLELGETRYRPPRPGLVGMTRAAARLVMETRRAAEIEAESRRAAAFVLAGAGRGDEVGRTVCPPRGAKPGYLRFPVLVGRARRQCVRGERARRLGIMPGYPASLVSLPAVRARLADSRRSFRGAEELVRELITLPTHTLIRTGEREAILWMLSRRADVPHRASPQREAAMKDLRPTGADVAALRRAPSSALR
jgi:dTDP-4-amino-4,6-dideoxygalactose transaminase